MTKRLRRRDDLSEPRHGWDHPWLTAFEIADNLDTTRWTLVGGLMVQAHAIGHDIAITRPTADIDVLLHIEVEQNVVAETHHTLTGLGYTLKESFGRLGPHYRYMRGAEKVDVMAADQAAPRSRQELGGRPMFAVDGGT